MMMILEIFLRRSKTPFGVGSKELAMTPMVFSFLMWGQR